MKQFTDAVLLAIDQRNYTAALFISLSLPDICVRLEAVTGVRPGRSKYMAWFETYMGRYYTKAIGYPPEVHAFMTGEDCYALRCALLHSGRTQIDDDKVKTTLEKIHFTAVEGMHCNQLYGALQIDVAIFCRQLCSGVLEWEQTFRSHFPEEQHRIDELLTVHIDRFVVDGFHIDPPS